MAQERERQAVSSSEYGVQIMRSIKRVELLDQLKNY